MAWSKWQERLFRIVPPLALAVAFWGIIGLLVVFATAEGKDSPFTAFFTAFGAVGQTFFAFMVWRLSREQFAFTKKVSDRQARIDAFAHRLDALQKWQTWRMSSMDEPLDERLEELSQLSWIIGSVFNDETMAYFGEVSARFMAFIQDVTAFRHAIDESAADEQVAKMRMAAELALMKFNFAKANLTLFMRNQVRLDVEPQM